MSVLWKKIEFNKGQSDCEAIIIAPRGLGQSPGGFSGGQSPPNFFFFFFFNAFKVIKWFTMVLQAEEDISVYS